MQCKRPSVPQPVDPDKFPSGLHAGLDSKPARGSLADPHAYFFAEFADCRGIIVLAGIEVPRTGRVPQTGRKVFAHRTLLQKDPARRIENEHMYRPMPQTPGMHLAAECPVDDLVAFVDDVEPFLATTGLYIEVHSCPFVLLRSQNTMPKIDISKVAEILKKNQVDPALLRRVVEEMNLAAQPDGGDGDKPPAVKKQFVILVSDPDGKMPKTDLVGWVLQIPESESVATTQDRLFRCSYDYNTTKKGQLLPVKTVGEAIETVPAKFFKEADIWVKTKTPVLVLKTDNEIPKE